jgi:Na+/melibiose symporter-like transporter
MVIDTSHIKRDALEGKHKFAYSVGHFSNDLCAAGWFFYFTYYLKYVIKMEGGNAGLVMLAGQVADGITTPLVGLGSDKFKTPIGSRAPWYIVGTLIVLPCFFMIFWSPYGVGKGDPGEPDPEKNTGQIIGFYVAMASLFNIGWASVQIANMSVVNSITHSTQNRDVLVA